MLKMPNVMRNLHGISIWKTLQAFYSYSTNILENLLGTLKIWKEINQLPISCCFQQNMFE